jgi:hypothetical protein
VVIKVAEDYAKKTSEFSRDVMEFIESISDEVGPYTKGDLVARTYLALSTWHT